MTNKDMALPQGDRATHEQSPSVSAVPVGIPSALKAYAVLENYENTGGIIFARHAVVARRIGAQSICDSEFSDVSCRRARWADKFADGGIVPASECVWNGWHFECHYCGDRIDRDVSKRGWTPDCVIGSQHGAVYCDKSCRLADDRRRDFSERLKQRTLARYTERLSKRFPGIKVRDMDLSYHGSHIYVNLQGRIEQVVIGFDWPQQKVGPAWFRWSKGGHSNGLTCCNGDKDAFEAFAAQAIEARRAETERLGAKHESAVPQECAQGDPHAPN